MDFFAHQEAAHRRTALLILYFALAVVLIVAAIYTAAAFIFVYDPNDMRGSRSIFGMLWNPQLFAVVSIATLVVIAAGSLYKIAVLRRGGEAVAEALGATLVDPSTRNPNERQLLNVVAEMSIASGTTVPAVYVLRDEAGINAFAAGYSTDDAIVAVTRGALETLSRAGLQGVIAHEFSHILKGDMRLNLRLMGVLHGILLIGQLGRFVLRGARHSYRRPRKSDKGTGGVMLFALALLIVGYIGLFFGNLIKAAVSRQREFLADAAAVQFTRNPDGLTGALKKIGGLRAGSTLNAPGADMAGHLYFADGLAVAAASLYATHPPLDERIRRIDPSWDGAFPYVPAKPSEVAQDIAGAAPAAKNVTPDSAWQGPWGTSTHIPITPARSVARAGTLDPEHLTLAEALVAGLPAAISAAAEEPYGARALAHALLINPDETVRQNQIALLRQHADPGVFNEFQKIDGAVADLPRGVRLPVMTMCLQALRRLSNAQYEDFQNNLNRLIGADDETSPFELALMRMLRRHLAQHFADAEPVVAHRQNLERLENECCELLSALANLGQDDPNARAAAFEAGISELRLKRRPMLPRSGATEFSAVEAVLDKLVQLKPSHKRRLVAACTSAIIRDGKITAEEGEVLRVISDSLEVPMPPFVGSETDIVV